MTHRVAVTALGCISAAGQGLGATLRQLTIGSVHLRCEPVPGLPLAQQMPLGRVTAPLPMHPNRSAALAIAAAEEALTNLPRTARRSLGLSVGCCTGGMASSEGDYLADPQATPASYRQQQPHRVAQTLVRRLGCRGPVAVHAMACASSACAIAEAADWIRCGLCERVLAVGTDALCRTTMAGFTSLRVVDAAPCRPLCRDRAGMNLGEGAAALLLERADLALAPLSLLTGWGVAADAHHATAPDPAGRGLERAIRTALDQAGKECSRIAYAQLHGTGTQDNDTVEAAVLSRLAPQAAVASVKGALGHCMGAAAALGAVAAVLAIREGLAWPSPGADLDRRIHGLDVVCATSRPLPPGPVLCTSLAFGGCNAALLFEAVP